MYCGELISTLVDLLINIPSCHLVLTIMLRCTPYVVRIDILKEGLIMQINYVAIPFYVLVALFHLQK